MSTCNINIDPFQAEDSSLDVSDKYTRLMRDTLGEDSLYARAKDTISILFKDLQITEAEKAKLISEYVAQMSVSLSSQAMQTALMWEKEERDGAYALAKIKADTEILLANAKKVEQEICLAEKQTEQTCANITSIVSASIRDNGKPTGFEADGCTPTGLEEDGLKYYQTQQSKADSYSRYADAYRKSGVVEVGTDIADGLTKGLSGDEAGYTHQQEINAERLRVAYEDSKRNHAANSSATMISGMLSAEIAPNEQDVQRWRDAVDYLNHSHSSTSNP
jgi:hypothetical protein